MKKVVAVSLRQAILAGVRAVAELNDSPQFRDDVRREYERLMGTPKT